LLAQLIEGSRVLIFCFYLRASLVTGDCFGFPSVLLLDLLVFLRACLVTGDYSGFLGVLLMRASAFLRACLVTGDYYFSWCSALRASAFFVFYLRACLVTGVSGCL